MRHTSAQCAAFRSIEVSGWKLRLSQETSTPVKAVEWRLIVLESVAGVPGFVAAGFRHFRSLRCASRFVTRPDCFMIHIIVHMDRYHHMYANAALCEHCIH